MPARLTLLQSGLAYGTILLTLGVLDGIWLGWLAKDFYRREMVQVMAESVNVAAAAAFYLLYPIGVVYLGLLQPPESLAVAAFRCGVIGLVAYGTYNLTAMSVIRGWSFQLLAVDMLWGTFATALAGTLATLVTSRISAPGS